MVFTRQSNAVLALSPVFRILPNTFAEGLSHHTFAHFSLYMTGIPTNHEDEFLLLEQAKGGDATAFGELYRLYFAPIYRYIYFRVKHAEEAEDLTQSVFTRVYASLDRYEHRGSPLLAFLYTVARNAIIDYWRKKKSVTFDDPEHLQAEIDAAQKIVPELQDPFDSATLRSAIQRLTDDQQEVVVLRFINDLPNRDIAEQLGKSEEAIRQLQSRALKALRQILQEMRPHGTF